MAEGTKKEKSINSIINGYGRMSRFYEKYGKAIDTFAKKNGVPRDVIWNVLSRENGLNNFESMKNKKLWTGMEPGAYRTVGMRYRIGQKDPLYQLEAAVKHLKYLYDNNAGTPQEGDWRAVQVGYNRGAGGAQKFARHYGNDYNALTGVTRNYIDSYNAMGPELARRDAAYEWPGALAAKQAEDLRRATTPITESRAVPLQNGLVSSPVSAFAANQPGIWQRR